MFYYSRVLAVTSLKNIGQPKMIELELNCGNVQQVDFFPMLVFMSSQLLSTIDCLNCL